MRTHTLFENTYLVTDKLETFTHEDVDAAEAALGTRFPEGYREYVTTLGKGEYCNFVWMYAPAQIVKSRESRRSEFEEYAHFWEDGFDVLSRGRLLECIVIGASKDADLIVFHPDAPEALYELPRHDSTIFLIGETLGEALTWYRQERLKIKLGYFNSQINQKGKAVPEPLNLSLNDLQDWLVAMGEYDHLEKKWNENPGISLETYRFLEGRMDLIAPELGEIMAFYKSFSGYVSASIDMVGRVSAQLVYDAEKDTDLMEKIMGFLQSRATQKS